MIIISRIIQNNIVIIYSYILIFISIIKDDWMTLHHENLYGPIPSYYARIRTDRTNRPIARVPI